MRISQYLLSTIKEIPTDAEIISHQLMLRSGMIRKLASGLYIWLPTGLRVLHKVKNIIREEMNKIGAIEISMPIVQPADLWQESGRLNQYGLELLHFTDRSMRSFILGPTHEEVITFLIRNEINSYKQLPLNLYQIQTKFRDEIRPRFGILRSREFIMKDAYSFHIDQNSLQSTYDIMYNTYINIFTRMGLEFRVVRADTGSIGGNISHEFQVLAASGESNIVFSTMSDYAANIDLAEAVVPVGMCYAKPNEQMRLIDTHDINTSIDELIKQFSIPITKTIRTIIIRTNSKKTNYQLLALIVRGDHQLSEIKVKKLLQITTPLIFATEEDIYLAIGTNSNSLGPINLPLPLIIDRSVAVMSDFIAGANTSGKYFFGINWERDLPLPKVADLRKVTEGDLSPDGKGILKIKQGIEVGHIFKLGTKYSQVMKTTVLDKNGYNKNLIMGCYGIGITRVIAAVIEQNHDEHGILWPKALAPFDLAILPMNMYKTCLVKKIAEDIYQQLQLHNIDILFDDRKEHSGVMFADVELIGIPHILIISNRSLEKKEVEYKNRLSGEKQLIKINETIDFLINKIIIAK